MLVSASPAAGPVRIAVYPWEFALVPPDGAMLTDRVISVHQDRGALVVRLQRCVVRTPAFAPAAVELADGALVGLHVAARDVRVLSD